MGAILAALHLDSPDSLKRALTTGLGAVALLAINPLLAKWGLPPLSDVTIGSVASVIAMFVLQSGLKSKAEIIANAEAAGVAAAGEVKSTDDAVAALNAKIAELTAKRAALVK